MKNQPTKLIYGRTAYNGFAKAIGSTLGLSVQVDDGTSACIDVNGTIYLPGMSTFQTEREFECMCGTLVHELAHQFYKSHKLIDPNRAALEHDCLNAILDVADETWIDGFFQKLANGRPGQLLTTSSHQALSANWKRYVDWSNASSHAWKVLCAGIFVTRLPRERNARILAKVTARYCRPHGVDAKACFRLMRRARLTKSTNPAPTSKRFRKLLKLAAELATLLTPFAASATGAAGNGGTIVGKSLGEALATGATSQPDGTTLATAQDGVTVGDATAHAQAEQAKAAQGHGGAGGGRGGREFDSNAFAMTYPAVERVAQRIATDGDGIARDSGLSSGPILGDAYRLMTDGQCLGRWQMAEHADGVAVCVLLDCSGSMGGRITECAGVARAFAIAMANAGPVKTYAFASHVFASDFCHVNASGGTGTHLAIEKADKWLATQGAGERWIVCITDGDPDCQSLTDAAVAAATQRGVRVLAIGLQVALRMRGATCVAAIDPTHLAIELDAAAHLIEHG
jgi:hypothetical protein